MTTTPQPSVPRLSLQERFAPDAICFGCGPANEEGLRIRSFPEGDGAVAEWVPQGHHQAFPGFLNGGIIGALLDCHGNWTAAHHLMGRLGRSTPPTTVTAEFAVKLLRPTPAHQPIRVLARVAEATDDRVTVDARIEADDKVTATCQATFVAVKQGHPAYDRW